jgi:hypothetical protein
MWKRRISDDRLRVTIERHVERRASQRLSEYQKIASVISTRRLYSARRLVASG